MDVGKIGDIRAVRRVYFFGGYIPTNDGMVLKASLFNPAVVIEVQKLSPKYISFGESPWLAIATFTPQYWWSMGDEEKDKWLNR